MGGLGGRLIRSEVSTHLAPQGNGPEEKSRRRKGVISLAQVGGWGIASQPKYPFHNGNMHEGKSSRRGPGKIKFKTLN